MKRLSKSRYTLFSQCPKALWLRVYKPEEAEVDEVLQARFEKGNEVGEKAMGLFGDFKKVTVKNADGSLDLAKMIELTQQRTSARPRSTMKVTTVLLTSCAKRETVGPSTK